MHRDKPLLITELHAHFRSILESGLTVAQLALFDYYSSQDPLYQSDDEDDEFPLFDGIPDLTDFQELYPDDEDELDEFDDEEDEDDTEAYLAAQD